MTETTLGAESLADGVYSVTTITRYNAAGQPLTGVQKKLIFSPTLESKSFFCQRTRLDFHAMDGNQPRIKSSTDIRTAVQ